MSDNASKLSEGLEQKVRQEIREPSLYKVILLNDDYTTMDFVVHVLETVFRKQLGEATRIMLNVHKKGSGLCGVYTREIAESKVAAVRDLAVKNAFPLKCIMEKE
ncbi:MAG TPA: ATP-dependent Clp protease adapter ClpS [Dissulfurispiraceae bacterium]|nr:ATP-dependent Clp protease adapter ClpS [Dissulfurispiraceae bacterium]